MYSIILCTTESEAQLDHVEYIPEYHAHRHNWFSLDDIDETLEIYDNPAEEVDHDLRSLSYKLPLSEGTLTRW